eukprot:3561171-Rhodomonas_salina.1
MTHAVPAVQCATSLCPAASREAASAWGGPGARACACPATLNQLSPRHADLPCLCDRRPDALCDHVVALFGRNVEGEEVRAEGGILR